MAVNWSSPPPDPVPGQVGHFDHHVWLKEALLELHAEVVALKSALKDSSG